MNYKQRSQHVAPRVLQKTMIQHVFSSKQFLPAWPKAVICNIGKGVPNGCNRERYVRVGLFSHNGSTINITLLWTHIKHWLIDWLTDLATVGPHLLTADTAIQSGLSTAQTAFYTSLHYSTLHYIVLYTILSHYVVPMEFSLKTRWMVCYESA